MLDNELLLQNDKIKEKVGALKLVFLKSEPEIIKIGLLTNISLESFPNYINYKHIISGITQARMIKGVNGKRGIESQIKKLLETYELEEINNDLIEKAAELMIATFDSVFLNSGEKVKQKYIKAMEDIEFLYINLKLAVKIIAESLKKQGVQLANRTLNYITEGIKHEKKDIAQRYINAHLSKDKKELELARENYRQKMEKMLNDYVSTLNVPFSEVQNLGMEQSIVNVLGKDTLELITGYLLLEIKERVMIDSRVQRMLTFE